MDRDTILQLLRKYRDGSVSEDDILKRIITLPYEDIGYASIDHHRTIRWGFPEVIFCQGKTPEQVAGIAEKIIGNNSNLLATRADPGVYDAVNRVFPDAKYNEPGRTISLTIKEITPVPGYVPVITAGTADLPVAQEALETGKMLGITMELISDIGVAGIHRLLDKRALLERASVVIVAAGMEGALPSVIGGLVQAPVIAVPTSVGYGTSLNGFTPLLAMLNSCVPGIAVMNVDNGFGASFLAFRILRLSGEQRDNE